GKVSPWTVRRRSGRDPAGERSGAREVTSIRSHAPDDAHPLRLDAQPRVALTLGASAHRVGQHVGDVSPGDVGGGDVSPGDVGGGVAAAVAGRQLVLAVNEQGRVVLDVRPLPVVEPLGRNHVALAVRGQALTVLDGAGDCTVHRVARLYPRVG